MALSGIITLTTDMGLQDYYVAAVKGVIYGQLPDARIVDISHQIRPFSTVNAALVLRNAYPNFPKGTVHIIGVNPETSDEINHLIVMYEGQYFIGADNGVFSLIMDRTPSAVFELNLMQDSDVLTFPTRDLFAKAASHLARGGTPEVIGKRIEGIRSAKTLSPVIENSEIRGTVIHIDTYGNIVTNITRQTFKEVGKGRDFAIMFKKAAYDIRTIHQRYDEVPSGERVALFSSSGFLEIAINKGAKGNGGGANSLFGLKLDDIIRVEFNASPNR